MKKLFLLLSLVVGTLGAFSQVALSEDFSSGLMPPTGWTIDAQAGNWSVRASANAGGEAPEARMSWSPEFNTTTRLITPQIDLSGNSTVLLQFKQTIDHYSGSYQIGVATRKDGGAWTNAWSRNVTSSVTAEQLSIVLNDANVNSSTFQFCIFFSGNSYNINYWYLDDIVLIIPANLDAAMTSLEVPTYFTGSKDVKGKITNMGISPITSFQLQWQIDEEEVHSNTVTGQNLSLGASYNFTATDQVTLDPGIYTLRVWVSDVNGTSGPDDVSANDTIIKVVHIPTQTVPRKPFFEEFTSSTCAPCATFNNTVFNPFIAQHGDEIVFVKYQMNWPGSGDIYYTAEGGQRRDYYGVSFVPDLYVDGKNTATSSTGVNTAFNNSLQNPAFVDINGYYTISGNNIAVEADLTAYTDISNATLHVVIFEGMTTQNVGNNGETQFHHVMMRLLPDGNGSAAVLSGGVPLNVSHLVDMTDTNVEEMEDLQVAIFLQDDETKAIFQAAYATLTGAFISLTPENNATEVLIDQPLLIQFSEAVRMIGGDAITSDNIATFITLEQVGDKGIPVAFTAEIDNSNTLITLTPTEDLLMSTDYLLTVAPVENMNGLATYEATSAFKTQTNVGIILPAKQNLVIYPNPARDLITVNYNESLGNSVSLKVYGTSGSEMSVKRLGVYKGVFNIDVSTLPAGVYFMQLTGSEKSATTRFVVLK